MKALEGMIVVDFTQAFSGPFCTMQLADFGAKVIKIERPFIGDQSREWTPFKDGYSAYYASINRNKLGVAIDNVNEETVALIKKLLKKADVLVENFKVGTLEKFGLGYEDVKAINPGIIYASISGFGQTGTLRKAPAYDNVIQSVSGIQSLTGYADAPGVRCASAIGDSFSGMNCALGILMAYRRKRITGEGSRVDVSMYDTIFGIEEPYILTKSVKGYMPKRAGNSDEMLFYPSDAFRCADGLYTISAIDDEQFAELCGLIGREEAARDARFADNPSRCKNSAKLWAIIEEAIAGDTREELDRLFEGSRVIHAPFLSTGENLRHPQTKARGIIIEIDDPGVGHYSCPGNPMMLSETPASYASPAPLMGQYTRAILEELGCTEEEIRALAEKKLIQCQ